MIRQVTSWVTSDFLELTMKIDDCTVKCLKVKICTKKFSQEILGELSEKGGFEPPDPVLAGQLLSREPDSASLAPLQVFLRNRVYSD